MPVLRSTSAFFGDSASLIRRPVEAISPNSVSKMTPRRLDAGPSRLALASKSMTSCSL